jgi:hypothetical protein
MTSRFVTTRLGPDGVQSGHKDVYWFGPNIPTSIVLLYTRVLVEGVTSTSREGGAPRSLVCRFRVLVAVCSDESISPSLCRCP